MKINILGEAGLEHALNGISLSYRHDDLNLDAKLIRMRELAPKLAQKEKGHNKFLRQICLWLDINAPRYFWQQFDTYQVGTVRQSESTMHTAIKRHLTQNDFISPLLPGFLEGLNFLIDQKDWKGLKEHLPEGFLQRRVVTFNYQVLRTIIKQRHDHRLLEWKIFIDFIYKNVEHPEFLPKKELLKANH